MSLTEAHLSYCEKWIFGRGTYNTPTEKRVIHKLIKAGGRLNKKDGLTRYGDSHVKDKTS